MLPTLPPTPTWLQRRGVWGSLPWQAEGQASDSVACRQEVPSSQVVLVQVGSWQGKAEYLAWLLLVLEGWGSEVWVADDLQLQQEEVGG